MTGIALNFNVFDYLLLSMMVICILTDLKSRKIYNVVLIPFLLVGLAANTFSDHWQGLSESVKGLFLGLVLLFIPFAKGGIGGGDVKLLAVIGSIKGPLFVLMAFLYGAIAGGIFALALLIWHRRLLTTLTNGLMTAANLLIKRGIVLPVFLQANLEPTPETLHLPYSLPIGAGVMVTYYTMLQNLAG